MKTMFSVMRSATLAGLVCACLTGCASYSFRGTHETAGREIPAGETVAYRLRSYECGISHPTVSPWSIARFAGATSTDQSAVEKALRECAPQRWTGAADALPVDVRIGEAQSDVAWFGGFCAYMLTLGCWPANIMTYKDDVPVFVTVGERQRNGRVRYRSKGYLSVWLPFALWRTDDQDGYTGEHRRGSGIMTAPHTDRACLNDMKAVFAAELAAEINALLSAGGDGLR